MAEKLKGGVEDDLSESQISKIFVGATVFLTGGTGFLGKLLIEKLLRCCPAIKKIYLLTRAKKNKSILKRLQEQFDDAVFDTLRKEVPDFIEKIGVIEGDMVELNLGISDEDRTKLINEVNFIFHGAATLRFDESLKTAVKINVRGTREILNLARACKKLRAHVHISTAYSNCTRKDIDEVFYESVIPGEKLIEIAEYMDEKLLNAITPGLLGDYPNTYVYTKAAAEDIVRTYSKVLPVALFRPSIVLSTYKEPVPGWTDNLYGPTGAIVGMAVRLLRVLNCDPKAVADMIPGDFVVNGCLAVAWKTAKTYLRNHEETPVDQLPMVYNSVSSVEKPITYELFVKYTKAYDLEAPSTKPIYPYLFILMPYAFFYRLLNLVLHWIPAYIVDAFLVTIGKKRMLVKAYTKIAKFIAVTDYFRIREWKFSNDNTQKLFKELCDVDKRTFNFDVSSLDWKEYFIIYIKGLRQYILTDSLKTKTLKV
ncbi:fatty acyl-CoA reductase wat-like [Melitaea cinxia]|uniref:fatty acyl-CoA reductase wat-like n=1 Tax=Melitaea cinxia TaxID=113334 RepID=UPI001E27469A|nr:fatty acyl-CoA reductase wat-like [Melitaea cinxia]